jgi:ATP-dependent Clp protease protease subunit
MPSPVSIPSSSDPSRDPAPSLDPHHVDPSWSDPRLAPPWIPRVAGGAPMPGPLGAIDYRRTREMTIDEILLENRVIFLVGDINHVSAARVMMQILYLEDQKRGQEINLYINSPGGSVDDTLALYDTMQFVSSRIATFCIGRAYSGGAVLLCAGTTGTDIQIQAEQILKAKRTINEIISKHTGQPVDRIARDGERDKFFSADEAKEYGLVDAVFTPDTKKKAAPSDQPDKEQK